MDECPRHQESLWSHFSVQGVSDRADPARRYKVNFSARERHCALSCGNESLPPALGVMATGRLNLAAVCGFIKVTFTHRKIRIGTAVPSNPSVNPSATKHHNQEMSGYGVMFHHHVGIIHAGTADARKIMQDHKIFRRRHALRIIKRPSLSNCKNGRALVRPNPASP